MKYLILRNLTIACVIIALLSWIYQAINFYWFEFYYSIAIVLIPLAVYFLLPKSFKVKSTVVNICAFVIAFILFTMSFSDLSDSLRMEKASIIDSEYGKFSCEEIREKFKEDLKNNELKYFSAGMVTSGELSDFLEDNDVFEIYLGCGLFYTQVCYNKEVYRYFKDSLNVDLYDY